MFLFRLGGFVSNVYINSIVVCLKSSSSHLWWDSLLNSLDALVCLVYLGPLSESGGFQITSVEDSGCGVLDGLFNFSEIGLVQSNSGHALGRSVGLGGGLLKKSGSAILCGNNIVDGVVGKSGVLVLVEGLDVSLFNTEDNGSSSLGLSVSSLSDEAVVVLGEFPNKRRSNHFVYLFFVNETTIKPERTKITSVRLLRLYRYRSVD